MSINDGSWLGTSAWSDLTTQRRSACRLAVLSNSSLTSRPDWPYFRNLNGERMMPAVFRSVRREESGTGLPCNASSLGLGSKVSTWLGPPFMNRCTRRLALAGCRGERGDRESLVAASAVVPRPNGRADSHSRRQNDGRPMEGRPMADPQSTKEKALPASRAWAACRGASGPAVLRKDAISSVSSREGWR